MKIEDAADIAYAGTERRSGYTLSPDFVRKVLPFGKPGRHAQVNAAFSAQLLEADRRRTRQEEIKRLVEGYTQDVIELERVIGALREEYRLLENAR